MSPSESPTPTSRSLADGAAPAMPLRLLDAAAATLATAVPCPGASAPAASVTSVLRATTSHVPTTLPARSGCDAWKPLSRTAIVTPAPREVSHAVGACSAFIIGDCWLAYFGSLGIHIGSYRTDSLTETTPSSDSRRALTASALLAVASTVTKPNRSSSEVSTDRPSASAVRRTDCAVDLPRVEATSRTCETRGPGRSPDRRRVRSARSSGDAGGPASVRPSPASPDGTAASAGPDPSARNVRAAAPSTANGRETSMW